MFEYMNMSAFVVVLFFSITIFMTKDKFTAILVVFLYILIAYDAYSSYDNALENMKYFNNKKSLTCFSGGGLYSSANKYYVDKSSGWILKKDYFIKDSLMIRANKCDKN